MSKLRIGINGFGRIGRQTLKAVHRYYRDSMEVVAVNDLFEIEKNANLLKYDTTYGRFADHIEVGDGAMIVGDWRIQSLAERDPSRIPWDDLGVDVVIESTGIFRTGPQARAHLDAGAKKVVITAPAKQEDLTVVLGVNDSSYDPRKHHVVSNASCTTNCLAPVALVLHRAFGIEKASMSTVHAYTNDQRILDLPHKDPRRARAAACNIIPTTTGAAKAVGTVIPELDGKIDGYALRVPVPTVSVVDFSALLSAQATREELNMELQRASEQELRGILAYNEEPLVSSDFIMDPHSAIVEPQFNGVQEGNLAKVVAWYDNEWGYSCRVADLIRLMADKGL
jgi:glyceraldehyde 3-phosphate dehydrogenase